MFKLEENGTSVRTELLAGLTTYVTMVYIVFVNPAILAEAGMDQGAVFVATCLAAALRFGADGPARRLAVGAGARHGAQRLLHLHRGEGAWACRGRSRWRGVPSGVLFLIVSLPIREWLVNSIPKSLKLGIGAGIGLFLA